MITVRRSHERGYADHGWLQSYHSFSFAHYYDPRHMNFRNLRVINEDWIAPGQGFPMHPHQDMEIVTYIIEGQLEHKDSTGGGEVLGPGEIQRMSAGTGIRHSEFNPSSTDPVHLLQIWIETEKPGINPDYEQKSYREFENLDGLTLLAARENDGDGVSIHQDVNVFSGRLPAGSELHQPIADGRHVWVQIVSGELTVNGNQLGAGDAVALSEEATLEISAGSDSRFLVFDLN